MMLAVMEEEKAPAELPKAEPKRVPQKLKSYRSRRPKRAEILDIQEATAKRIKQCKGTSQEFVSLVRAWSELETLLQNLETSKSAAVSDKVAKVAKSLAAVAEDDPAVGTPATDKPTT